MARITRPRHGRRGPTSQNEFTRLELEAKIFAPPQVKFKDLEAMVSSRIVRDQLHFTYRFDFMRITSDTVLVPITVKIPNNQMSFHDRDGVQSATLDLFARISTLSGRVVQTFEDTVRAGFPRLAAAAIAQVGLGISEGGAAAARAIPAGRGVKGHDQQ